MNNFLVGCLIAFLSGVIGFASSDPQLRMAGIVLAGCAVGAFLIGGLLDYIQEQHEAQEDRKYFNLRQQERLNDLEVWREETAPETQFLKDRLENLEQRGKHMEVYQAVSVWPLLLGLVVSALYFLIKTKGAKK